MMRKRPGTIPLILLVLSLLVLWPALSPAAATDYWDELQKKQQELQRVEERLKELRGELERARQRERSVLGELEYIQAELEQAQNRLKQIQERIERTESEVEETQSRLKEAALEYENRKETAAQRVRSIYENGVVGYLEVLLMATDFHDLITRFDLLSEIIAYDMNTLEDLRAEKERIEEEKRVLEQKLSELESMKEEAERYKATIQSKASERERLLEQIKTDEQKIKAALAEEEKISKELEAIISALQEKAREQALGTGVLTWPTPGYTWVTSPFGWRIHPILGTRSFHTGLDIGAPMRSRVVAADTGRVIHSGWIKGYGWTVIIDHGNYISTLYAHLDELLVTVGQKVLKGEVIARSGTSGFSTGPHLHFEVRYKGAPVDPWQYLRR